MTSISETRSERCCCTNTDTNTDTKTDTNTDTNTNTRGEAN